MPQTNIAKTSDTTMYYLPQSLVNIWLLSTLVAVIIMIVILCLLQCLLARAKVPSGKEALDKQKH